MLEELRPIGIAIRNTSEGLKKCANCKQTLPFNAFNNCSKSLSGVRSRCRPCEKPTEEQLQRNREAKRRRYEADPYTVGISQKSAKYGIPKDVAVELSASACFICGESSYRMHIDHCHRTGAVRGALCINCNTALGKFKDDSTLVRRAAEYLESGRDFRSGVDLPCDSAVLPDVDPAV